MSLETALDLIESVSDYRVLFVGEAITDEYHYVTPLSKSPKQYLIPVLYHDKEAFEGGVTAAASHLRSFCKTVDVCRSAAAVRKVRFVEDEDVAHLAVAAVRAAAQSAQFCRLNDLRAGITTHHRVSEWRVFVVFIHETPYLLKEAPGPISRGE